MVPDQVFEYIDAHFERFVEELRVYLRQPSVPPEDTGGTDEEVRQTAEMTVALMKEVGIEAKLLETAYHPVAYGELEGPVEAKTLIIFSHYGVVAPGPCEEWVCDPYAAEIIDDRIVARGASDPKGNVMACFKAVEAWQQVAGGVPLNLKFVFPCGERARSDPDFADNYRHLLAADALMMVDAGFTRDENCPIHLGSAGSLSLDLRVKTGTKDPYIIWAQLIPDAAYCLIWALSSVKDKGERVLIEGFYDDVLPPTKDEKALMEAYPWRDEGELAFWGIESFVTGARGVEAIQRLLYEPTFSITGFRTGYTGLGLVPSEAEAQVNFHLVPNQRADDIIDKFRRHLEKQGFGDVEFAVRRKYNPFAGSADSTLGRAILETAERVGFTAYLLPHSFELWGSLGRQLDLEQALFGIGDGDRKAHFPNENISLHNYRQGTKWVAAILEAYAHGSGYNRGLVCDGYKPHSARRVNGQQVSEWKLEGSPSLN